MSVITKGCEELPRFAITPLRPDWKWRLTSRGFALIGAILHPNQPAVMSRGSALFFWQEEHRLPDPEKPILWMDYFQMFNGSIRYRSSTTLAEEWGDNDIMFLHESGPFSVAYWAQPKPEMKGGAWSMQQSRIQLLCACGWRGKRRAIGGSRFMMQEQSQHRCRENFDDPQS